jgi:hypothetical protein
MPYARRGDVFVIETGPSRDGGQDGLFEIRGVA